MRGGDFCAIDHKRTNTKQRSTSETQPRQKQTQRSTHTSIRFKHTRNTRQETDIRCLINAFSFSLSRGLLLQLFSCQQSMAATILCVGCGQAPTEPFRRLHEWWSARFLVLKNASGFEKYTNHVLCGTCQLRIFKLGRRSYDKDPGWDPRDSTRHAIDGKWTDGLDQDFHRILSQEEQVLRERYGCQLAVSQWIVHEPFTRQA